MLSRLRMLLPICGVAALFLGAASKGPVDQIPPDARSVKLHPVEQFTVSYKFEGEENGTSTEYWRDWGQRYVELRKTTLSVGGAKEQVNERVITDGAQVTTIDVPTRTATRRRNPMYGPLVEKLRGKKVKDLAELMMTAMGGKATGETATYAGEKCNFWSLPEMNSTQCVTDDGITLFIRINAPGFIETITATEVRRGDGGPDSDFVVGPEIAVQDLPDLNQFMTRPD